MEEEEEEEEEAEEEAEGDELHNQQHTHESGCGTRQVDHDDTQHQTVPMQRCVAGSAASDRQLVLPHDTRRLLGLLCR